MAYIGSTPESQNFTSGTDYFNGTGSQTVFTLTRTVNSVNDVEVVVNNVIQQPNSYTVSGTTLTLSAAPSSGTSNVYVRYLATNQQSFTVSNNTVGYNQLTADMQSKFAMKNRIINGAMVISQRNGTSSVTPPPDAVYVLDRWRARTSQSSKYSVQQNAGAVTPPSGFTNYLGVTSLSSYSVLTGDYFGIEQPIEGFNVADLGWGTVNAKTVTLSFWVRSSLTGTFSVNLNNNTSRAYPASYTISVANTWELKSITIPGDTSGTWATNSSYGIGVFFGLGFGATYQGTVNTWGSGTALSFSGATSVVGTNGATFYITGVQLEVGSSATGFEYRQYGQELALCQRYYYQSWGSGSTVSTSGNSFTGVPIPNSLTFGIGYAAYPVTMRAAPTITLYDDTGVSAKVSQPGLANGLGAAAAVIGASGFNQLNGTVSFSSGYPLRGQYLATAEL